LIRTTKDLRIACHLAEAALNLNGLPGFADGLRLLHRLIQEYWDDLAPQLDPSDPETRCAPLENLLNDPIHGPRLPTAIRSLNLLESGDLRLSLSTAMRPSDDLTAASIASSLRQIPVDHAKRLSGDLDDTIQALDTLQHELIERMADYAPSFNHLSESLGLIRQWFDAALKQQLQSRDSSEDDISQETSPGSASSTNFGSQSSQAGTAQNNATDPNLMVDQSLRIRADAYRQLTDAANVLQRLEPHSPIPYMVHRAVQMGQMPFPKLMSQWVKEESTLEMFCRELGLSSIDAASSRDEP
jgi:type VI secretion system protein ImpA